MKNKNEKSGNYLLEDGTSSESRVSNPEGQEEKTGVYKELEIEGKRYPKRKPSIIRYRIKLKKIDE